MTITAMADMSGTPYAVAVVLVIGIIVLRSLSPKEARSRMWLPITAFLAGPIIALWLLILDIFIISRDYITAGDYLQSFVPILAIGLMAGAIGFVGLWVDSLFQLRGPKKMCKSGPDKPEDKN